MTNLSETSFYSFYQLGMTQEELITKQQLRIEELEDELNGYKADFGTIYTMLYAVGAPLNDNVLGFNKEQLKWFFQLSNLIK